MWRLAAVAAMAMSTFALAPAAWSADDDKVILVDKDDQEMNAAIAKARASIGEFWKQYEKAGPGVADLVLKVRIDDGEKSEHFWLSDIARGSATLSGVIANDAEIVSKVKLGQHYFFKEADITDWSYTRNGKIVGNETMRVLLKKLPSDEAAQYRAMLETP